MSNLTKIDFKSMFNKDTYSKYVRLALNIKVVKLLSIIVFSILLVVLSYCSAKLFWSFFPEYVNKSVKTSDQTTNVRVERNYLDEIFSSKVFPASTEKIRAYNQKSSQLGSTYAKTNTTQTPVAPVQQQPVRPNIKITGILASDKPDRSVVILVFNGDENVYSEGEQLTGSAIRVSKIFEDRIELLSADRRETYTYYIELSETDRVKLLKEQARRNQQPVSSNNTVANNNHSSPKPETENGTVSNKPEKTQVNNPMQVEVSGRKQSSIVPEKITATSFQDFVNISPIENEQGTGVKGYRLNPGRKPDLFTRSGFKPNDLAIRVNGYDLTDPAQTRQLFAELSTTKNFEITVERDGVPENIYISIDNDESQQSNARTLE